MSALSDEELSAICTTAGSGMEMWLAGRDAESVNVIYYELGRAGAASAIPLPELIRALILILNLSRAVICSAAEVSGSEPLLTFCDYARYYLIRGYQDALR
jgi:hypothetical protein